MVKIALIAAAAAAMLAPVSAGSVKSAEKTYSSKNFTGKLDVLMKASNISDKIKGEAWDMAAKKLNKTIHMADKLMEFKNKTKKAVNLSKFEDHFDNKFDGLIDMLNATYQKIEEKKDAIEDKVDMPVKMVDEKIDHLKMDLEDKLGFLKNKTFGIKDAVEEKLEGIMAMKSKDN